MSDWIEVGEWVEREANRAAPMAKVAEALKRIGSLENAANEAQARLDGLRAREEQAVEDVTAKQAALDTALAEANAKLTESRQGIEEARAQAAQIIADAEFVARAKAADMTDLVQREVEKMTSDARKSLTGARAELATVTDQVIAKQSELSDIAATVTEKTAQLAELNRQLDDIANRLKR